jgi:hypothetical protein
MSAVKLALTTIARRCATRPAAWALGAVLLGAALLESPDGQSVRLRNWPGWTLPEVCASRRWFGWNCPLCGTTRSTLYLLRGQWNESRSAHRLGWLCVLVIVTTGVAAILLQRPTPGAERFTYACWGATFAALLVNRLLELCGW